MKILTWYINLNDIEKKHTVKCLYPIVYQECEILIIDTQMVPKKYKQNRSNTWYSPCIRYQWRRQKCYCHQPAKMGFQPHFVPMKRIERQTINSWDDGISEPRENWLLVTDELVEVHRDCKIDSDRLRRIYRIHLKLVKRKLKDHSM